MVALVYLSLCLSVFLCLCKKFPRACVQVNVQQGKQNATPSNYVHFMPPSPLNQLLGYIAGERELRVMMICGKVGGLGKTFCEKGQTPKPNNQTNYILSHDNKNPPDQICFGPPSRQLVGIGDATHCHGTALISY